VKRLLAITFVLASCGSGYTFPTAAPALVLPDEVEDAITVIEQVPEPSVGVITFGTSYDPETLDIPEPLTRFKRTYPVIAWSAVLGRGVDAAFVTWLVVRQSESGTEEIMFEVEEPIDDSSMNILANSSSLTFHVDHVAGMYVMRYLDAREVLAEGAFTLVN
jgi:hypothetical protein